MATTSEELWEIDHKFQDESFRSSESSREIDYQLQELRNQINKLGEKFGGFTEGLALPSMTKILQQKFGVEVMCPSMRVIKDGYNIEIDVLAYANSAINKAYVVEVKSHPCEESITQLKNLLEHFRELFPVHHNKQVFGILAAVDLSAALRKRILREGLYVARIHDQVFEMDTPEDFQPKAY